MRKFKLSSLFLIFCCLFWYSTCFADGLGNVGADNTRFNYKIGTVPARANAAAPTWAEANSVPLSVDLSGNLRTTATVTANPRTLTASSAFLDISAATTTQIVALSAGLQIKVYGFLLSNSTVAGNNLRFVYGTGVNCGTGTTNISPIMEPAPGAGAITMPPANFPIFIVPASNALCVVSTTANASGALVSYIQE